MKADFYEFYSKLCDLKPGQVAVSKDRTSIFVAGRGTNTEGERSGLVFIDLNNLGNDYGNSVNLNQPVHVLSTNDKFVITIE